MEDVKGQRDIGVRLFGVMNKKSELDKLEVNKSELEKSELDKLEEVGEPGSNHALLVFIKVWHW